LNWESVVPLHERPAIRNPSADEDLAVGSGIWRQSLRIAEARQEMGGAVYLIDFERAGEPEYTQVASVSRYEPFDDAQLGMPARRQLEILVGEDDVPLFRLMPMPEIHSPYYLDSMRLAIPTALMLYESGLMGLATTAESDPPSPSILEDPFSWS